LSSTFFQQINTEEDVPISVTIYHEGTDGIQLRYVDIVTNNRAAHCPVDAKLDADEFLEIECLG
jgi:hypothetical protein